MVKRVVEGSLGFGVCGSGPGVEPLPRSVLFRGASCDSM